MEALHIVEMSAPVNRATQRNMTEDRFLETQIAYVKVYVEQIPLS